MVAGESGRWIGESWWPERQGGGGRRVMVTGRRAKKVGRRIMVAGESGRWVGEKPMRTAKEEKARRNQKERTLAGQ